MSGGYEVVDEDHVGGREGVASEWKTIRAVFHNFANLPSKRNDCTESKVLKCHGSEWQIRLFPGGDRNSSKESVFVSLFLFNKSSTITNTIKANFRIRVPSAATARGDGHCGIFKGKPWGFKDYVMRENVIDASKKFLVNGKLTVEVDIQVMLDKPPAWTPTDTVRSDMLKLLDDTDNSDVIFDIGQGSSGKKKEEKQSPRTFYAHRNILSVRCPALAELAEGCDPEDPLSPKSATCE